MRTWGRKLNELWNMQAHTLGQMLTNMGFIILCGHMIFIPPWDFRSMKEKKEDIESSVKCVLFIYVYLFFVEETVKVPLKNEPKKT